MRIILRPLLYFTIAISAFGAYNTVSTHISAKKSLSWPDTKGVIIDSDIVEMHNVENWLKMNLAFLQMTIKTLEMQKSALEALSGKGTDKGS